ncbi:MAG: hypothetical protein ABJA37_00510 [Ferruginibacter sp.]
MKDFKLTYFGVLLIILGCIGFLAAAILSFTVLSGLDQGALPAASFLMIMIGVALAFPSMLQDSSTGGVSTMRIIVFSVVMLFCTIYLKIGWSITKLETLTIDQRWIYILGLAFGSKAFQRFGENQDNTDDTGKTETVSKEKTTVVSKEVTAPPASKGKDNSEDISK